MKYDFIIYGGGLSSEIAALALAQNNFKVCFIKNYTTQKTETNLVTFLSSGSINYLYSILDDSMDLQKFEDINKITCKLASSKKNSSITFDDESDSVLGKILPNKAIHKILDTNINKNKNIDTLIKYKSIRKKTHANEVSIKIDDTNEILANIFILSTYDKCLLNQTNFKFISEDLDQTALSMSIEGLFKKRNHAIQIFTPKGPLAFLPFSENHASMVWSLKNDSGELNHQKVDLENIVNQYFEKEIGSIKIKDIETHQLDFKFAKKLHDKKTIIIGNIAHNIHPIAGQGLNLSIKDISLFADIISKYASIGYEINNREVFNEFDQLRKIDNVVYSFGTLVLDKLFSSKYSFVSMATGMGMQVLENSKFAKRKIVNSATGTDHFKKL